MNDFFGRHFLVHKSNIKSEKVENMKNKKRIMCVSNH